MVYGNAVKSFRLAFFLFEILTATRLEFQSLVLVYCSCSTAAMLHAVLYVATVLTGIVPICLYMFVRMYQVWSSCLLVPLRLPVLYRTVPCR
jgi:hypothetical protein